MGLLLRTAVSLLLLGVIAAHAQTFGTISGQVTDKSDAVVARAKIVLTNVELGVTQETTTSEGGLYRFPLIPPGRYTISAAAQGFRTVTIRNIELAVNSSVRQDLTLDVADVTEQVTVEARAVGVDQETASLGEVIETRRIVELPLNGRNFLQLGQLTTGTLPPAVQNNESTTASFSGGRQNLTLSISGIREVSAAYLFDGIPANTITMGASAASRRSIPSMSSKFSAGTSRRSSGSALS